MAATTMTKADKELNSYSARLMEVQPRVSNELKMIMALELKCTTRTIETYLAGQGKKLPFAIELLKLAKKKLKETQAA